MLQKITFFFIFSLLLSSCGNDMRDMSCTDRCDHDYKTTFNRLNTSDLIGHTEKRVDSWEADKKRSNCHKKCSTPQGTK